MSRDIHKIPFDDGTKVKLAIFEDYLKEWLPVFLAKKEPIWKTINIFDFFAGPGSDINNYAGTPLIIKNELQFYFNNIVEKKLNVTLYLNEYDSEKYSQLLENVLPNDEDLRPYKIESESLDFKEAFENQFTKMGNAVNLLFLDQNGIKQISEEIFTKIVNLKQTDFLFFISSSTIKRFSEHPSIKQHINLDKDEIERTPYHKIHRLILEYYKSLIPTGKEYYLGSFTLKKNAGIYGLIFGSGHVLGIEKFINTCWKIDPERGEANFDIDDDKIIKGQYDIFGKLPIPKKVDLFEQDLEEQILSKKITTDKELYLFTLRNGFKASHTRKVLSKLFNDKKMEKQKIEISHEVCKPFYTVKKLNII